MFVMTQRVKLLYSLLSVGKSPCGERLSTNISSIRNALRAPLLPRLSCGKVRQFVRDVVRSVAAATSCAPSRNVRAILTGRPKCHSEVACSTPLDEAGIRIGVRAREYEMQVQ